MGSARLGRFPPSEVVPRDFQALSARRAARAQVLAGRYPAAREALLFYSRIALLQQRICVSLEPSHHLPVSEGSHALPESLGSTTAGEKSTKRQPEEGGWTLGGHVGSRHGPGGASLPGELLAARWALVELVRESGPDVLRETARNLDETACREALQAYLAERDTTSPRSFFARALLQPWAATVGVSSLLRQPNRCPRCGHPPQVGCLRPEGDGTALSLICSLCLGEWSFERGQCPECGEKDREKVVYYSAAELEHVQVQVCESCQRYFHLVNLSRDPRALPDVDEISALPLDVWAHDKGFKKLHPSLLGI